MQLSIAGKRKQVTSGKEATKKKSVFKEMLKCWH